MCEGNFTSIQNYLALTVTVINKLNDTRNKFNIQFYFVFIYIYTYFKIIIWRIYLSIRKFSIKTYF